MMIGWILFSLLIIVLLVNGFALWFSAKNKQVVWFIFLFILLFMGVGFILSIIYIIINFKKIK